MDKERFAYIVIGAGGFLGSAFSTFLKRSGFQVFNVYSGHLKIEFLWYLKHCSEHRKALKEDVL